MTTTITRRGILKALGIGAAALAVEPMLAPIVEPVRKLWFVGSNAPVGSRIETLGTPTIDAYIARTWSMKVQAEQVDLYDSHFDEILKAARDSKKAMYAQQDRDALEVQARGGGKTGVVDLSEGSEWSFENGTRIRFGKGGSLEYAQRDMDLAGKYVVAYAKKS